MFNKVILIGNLTRDCELRYTPSGTAVTKASLASNRKFKGQNGEPKEEVCFIDITLFGRTAEIANQYLKKGSKVLVEGRLTLEQWSDQAGQKRSKHSITVENLQMLDTKNSSNTGGYGDDEFASIPSQHPQQQQQKPNFDRQSSGGGYKENIPEIDINEDEIPF